MRRFNPIYYLLFILLVMGAFASMAQNSYGLRIMGTVAFSFALVFLIEFISVLRRKGKADIYALLEPVCLFVLSFIFGLRVFYIHFDYIELLFGAAAVVLGLIYLRKMIMRFRFYQFKNRPLALFVLVFHLSIIFFLLSFALVPFFPKTAEVMGVCALFFLLGFMIAGSFRKDWLVDGENVAAFTMVRHYKDHSIIIVSLCLLFSLYIGFNRIGVLPGIYSDEFPRSYFELVEKATLKKERPVNGKYRYEEFMARYREFLNNHGVKKK